MIKATILFKLVILCLLCTPAYSQEIPFGSSIEHGKVCKTGDEDKPVKTVRGRVVDRENQALEYVNIGIERKNFGTMSFRNGLFELDIPYKYRNDTLTFSHVGFVQERMPIANIDGFRTIELYENVNVLGEVLITANRPKIKQIGIKSYSRMIGGRALHSERATMMKPGKFPLKVEKLNIAFNWVDQR